MVQLLVETEGILEGKPAACGDGKQREGISQVQFSCMQVEKKHSESIRPGLVCSVGGRVGTYNAGSQVLRKWRQGGLEVQCQSASATQ